MMKYEIQRILQYKKDYKLAVKCSCDVSKLQKVAMMLANGETLTEGYQDHPLRSNYNGYRECHIESVWQLVYKITENVLVLTLYRTGTHSDLF